MMHVVNMTVFPYSFYKTIGKILNKLFQLDDAELKYFLFRLDLLE